MSATPDSTTGRAAAGHAATLGPLAALRRFRLFDPVPLSVLTALVFTVAGLVSLLARDGSATGYRPDDGLLVALTVATALPLAFLWWSPLVCLLLTVGLLVAQPAAGYMYSQVAVWAAVVASFVTVAFDGTRQALAGGFVVAAGMLAAVLSAGVTWQTAVATWVSLSVVWALAVAMRAYRTSAERAERRAALFAADREARAAEAVADERAHMARELHDSVGHALNVVVLHAGAAQRVIDEKPELVREALDSIEVASRQALGDIERMLGILRAPDEDVCCDVPPGLGQLETLCAQVREAGLPVSLRVEGERQALPASLDLTAYRIVQEALTNTLKHAGRTRASVDVRFGEGAVGIEVLDEGRGVAPGTVGGGRGLLGMRERVATFRGELTAGPRAEGGFAVRARLPIAKEST